MFYRNFVYSLKMLWRSKTLLFWTLAFPLMMATLFHLAFSSLTDNMTFEPIKIAVVDDDNYENNQILRTAMTELSDPNGDNQLFETTNTDEQKASALLTDNKIDGYITVDSNGKPKLTVQTSGTNQTIIQEALDEIVQSREAIEKIATARLKSAHADNVSPSTGQIAQIYQQATAEVVGSTGAKLRDKSNAGMDFTLIEYYSLIAMTCLQGGAMGAWLASRMMANMSPHGRRVAISLAPRWRLIISGALAAWLSLGAIIGVIYLYTIVGLGVNYGTHIVATVILSLAGSATGIALGVAVGVLIRASDQTKSTIMTAVTLTGCFLAGMMGITMKYIVDSTMPIINMVNPAAVITDGFYALYTAGVDGRYWWDVASLVIMTAIFIIISIGAIRRRQYDSI